MNYKRLGKLIRRMLYKRTGGRCEYCGAAIESADATLDHVVSRANGGSHLDYNLVLACAPCNHELGHVGL